MASATLFPSPHALDDPVNHYAHNIIAKYQRGAPPAGAAEARQPFVLSAEKYLHCIDPLIRLASDMRPVAIIGGGIGGLYAGMILQSLCIPYTIYESSDRIGGRLHTYKDFQGAGPNDYIDLGAMRFPKTPIMQPVMQLFDDLGLEQLEFLFEDRHSHSMLHYNGVRRQRSEKPIVPQDYNIDLRSVPPKYGDLGVYGNMANVLEPFRASLKEDVDSGGTSTAGWDAMMQYDRYSTRAYMSGLRADGRAEFDQLALMPYPLEVVEWCETCSYATGALDRALTETVLESLAFAYEPRGVEWVCIRGGASTVAAALHARLAQRPLLHTLHMRERVTAVRHARTGHGVGYMCVTSEHGGQAREARYGHVIATTTLPALRMVALAAAGLDAPQGAALRALAYAAATKIGVKFASAWWQDDGLMRSLGAPGAVVGGQSASDSPARRVVYPSHGVDDPSPCTVLMVSYTVGADALPWAGLAGAEGAPVVRSRVINDLVAIHGFGEAGRCFLEEQWQEAVLHSWNGDPHALGAFAMFGPGQFAHLYRHLTRPAAEGRLHFAGEAVSVRHGWVLGALEASKRAVRTIIHTSFPEKRQQFEEMWGGCEGWTQETLMGQVAITLEGLDPLSPCISF